jgi:hypothetical protein
MPAAAQDHRIGLEHGAIPGVEIEGKRAEALALGSQQA